MMRINWLSALTVAMVAFCLNVPGAAFAEDPKSLGEHEAWKTYIFADKSGKTCYAMAQPKDSRPKNVRRDPIYFMVTNKQKPRVIREVSVITGYPYRKNSVTTASIGSDKFKMYTKGDGAWVENNAVQKRFIGAMMRGASMIVKGTSSRGTLTTDDYSLSGLTAALKQIDEACK